MGPGPGPWGCLALPEAAWGCLGLPRAAWGLPGAAWGCLGAPGDEPHGVDEPWVSTSSWPLAHQGPHPHPQGGGARPWALEPVPGLWALRLTALLLSSSCCRGAAVERLLSRSCCRAAAVEQLLSNSCCREAAVEQLLSRSCCRTAPVEELLSRICWSSSPALVAHRGPTSTGGGRVGGGAVNPGTYIYIYIYIYIQGVYIYIYTVFYVQT